jgi:hypothetical protein
VLWGLFFVVIGLGKAQWTTLTGWLTLVLAFTTCTVPGFVYLLGETVPAWAVAASVAVTAIAFAPLAIRVATGRDASRNAPAVEETSKEPVLVHH